MARSALAIAALIALAAAVLVAQAVDRFEVASIKRSRAAEPGGGSSSMQPGGRYIMTNGPVRVLLNRAFPTLTNEIVGAPDWVTYDRYDVEARADHDLTLDEFAPRMRQLLEERFKLRAHLETKVRPIYELHVASATGRLGPTLRPSTVDCEAHPRACMTRGANGLIESNGTSMMAFVTWLPGRVGRPVVDKTGLTALYELRLKYSASEGDDSPSIETALREQLGLVLRPVDAPVEVLVVDQIERPTEN